ncbi:MAG: M20/M25/M40 family metallo-hydrolase [Thermoplasmatota archaeon]
MILEDLVRIPSTSGHEAEAVAWFANRAKRDGFEAEVDAAGNLHIHRGGPTPVWYIGHIDTVPGDIPVRIEDGELWGRGSVDAKGCLAAAYEALLASPTAPVRIVACVGEERDSPGAKHLLQGPSPERIMIGEPSGSDGLTLGYKGIVRAAVALATDAQHGGHPSPNALDQFMARWPADLHTGYGFGDVTLRLRDLHSSSDGLSDQVLAWLEVRIPPGLSPDAVVERLREAFPEVQVEEAWPAVSTNRRDPWVAQGSAAIRFAGMTPRPKHKTGTSDWNVLATTWDVPTVAFGPGDAALDHRPDERMNLDDYARGVAVLTAWFSALDQVEMGEQG